MIDGLPIPDRLVVLTFDDGVKSQLTFAAPLLARYGFGATFYIRRSTILCLLEQDCTVIAVRDLVRYM